ncbi:MAG: SRPBCC family protein [Nitriliruptorales bacterium]|nr:SRPBCC family protein [Nitriliruptorales bacterium]
MGPTKSSTVRFETRTTIDGPIEDVFARLTDLDHYGTWMHRTGLFGGCRQVSDGPVREGTRYVDRSRMGTFHGEVTEFEAPTRVSFVETMRMFGQGAMQARPAYELEPDGDRTIVHHVAEGEMWGWMRIMKPMAGMMASWERSRVLSSLARSFEQEQV